MLVIFLGLFSLTVFSFFFAFVEIIIYLLIIAIIFFTQVNWGLAGDVGEFMGVDLVSFLLIELSLYMGVLMFMASMGHDIFYESMYQFYMVGMVFLLCFCFMMMNLMGFYLLFESVLIPIIMMIIGWGSQPERLQAGLYMLFYTLGGSLPLLIFLLSNSESTSIFYLGWLKSSVSSLMFLLGVLAFLVKMPMFLMHLWLPKAHVEAPVAGSMVLAGVLLKLGIYGLYRVKVLIEPSMIEFSNYIVSIILGGGIWIGFICLCQVDIKALIAYSSVMHMGVILGGIFSMAEWGCLGSILVMLGHGLCSSGLFCLANIYYERFYTRSMILLKGLGNFFPYISFWWFLFVSVNMAAPPSMNLGGEILLIGGLIKWSFLVIIPLGIGMFLSASYSLYMYSFLNHGKGWVVYGGRAVSFREVYLMFLHLFPLIFWSMKMELFCLY
uniref:NADH dehydrogenase subunit 4 n=1 Tax=Alectorobius peruvianus TaxID=879266 RepID=UPI00223787CE|nr:NADH dehydrogenase subunit 4 [Alectorobius peruvianus]UYB78530.1 NADH dehydrogenase subunit 4 [Alectorobius peruvianus]